LIFALVHTKDLNAKLIEKYTYWIVAVKIILAVFKLSVDVILGEDYFVGRHIEVMFYEMEEKKLCRRNACCDEKVMF
jgi:hypothetical protein